MNDISEWEDESLSSDDEGFHELSLCINVGDEETKAKQSYITHHLPGTTENQ